MAMVGRSFGFYIKHWHLMEILFGNIQEAQKLALLKRLRNEEARKMVEQVGVRASKQAAVLMKQCADVVQEHFKGFPNCNLKKRTKPGRMEREWFVEFHLWPKRVGRRKLRWMVGVSVECIEESQSIPPVKRPAIVLWLWTKGGEEAENNAARIFGKRVKFRSARFGWRAGSIFLGEPIPIKSQKDFEVEMEPLLQGVRKALGKIREKDIRKLFAAGRRGRQSLNTDAGKAL